MKRRILALIFALILAFSMSTLALAAGNNSQPVTIEVVQKNVYNTNIVWEGFHFIYNFNKDGNGGWEDDTATVKVTNNSTNTAINVDCTITSNDELEEAVKNNVQNVSLTTEATPALLAYGGGSVTYTFKIEGAPTDNKTLGRTEIGTVTLAIS